MEKQLILFGIIMIITIIIANIDFSSKGGLLSSRANQAKTLFKENDIKRKVEELAEDKVKYSKRYEVETLCLQAGFKMTYAEYLMMSFGTAIISFLLVTVVMNNILLGLLFLLVGYMLPSSILTFLRNIRLNRMENQIGSFMQMVTDRYLNSKDFKVALELTAKEFEGEEPIYSELRKTVLEINLGMPVEDALNSLGRRTGNKFLERYADYYKVVSVIGTEEIRKKLLTQAFEQFEEHRQTKRMMKKEISEPVMNSYIMVAFIPVIVLYQIATSEGYIDFMTQTQIGKIGTAGITAVIIGAIWFINEKIGAPIE